MFNFDFWRFGELHFIGGQIGQAQANQIRLNEPNASAGWIDHYEVIHASFGKIPELPWLESFCSPRLRD
jgi:hypothetical protein